MLGAMYLILIAWFYVTLMMAIAEATNPVGSVLGGIVTFVLYGLLPMAIVGYIMATPARKRRLQAKREAEQRAWDAAQASQPSPPAAGSPAAADPAAAAQRPGATPPPPHQP